ncbi:hypothetical protein BDF19DRAFT_454018, partial [Syncephalis fuscata]
MTYLDAVLHETLRLRPVVAHGLPRVIPEGGVMMNNYFVPGGVSQLVIHN